VKPRFSANYTQPQLWRRMLNRFVGKPVKFLEIGCYEGRSSIWFVRNILTHPDASLTCVDPFLKPCKPYATGDRPSPEGIFLHNCSASAVDHKIKLQSGFSVDVLPRLEDSYQLIYIDGDHTAAAVSQDIELSWPLLLPGGILLFDDYLWKGGRTVEDRPRKAIDRFLRGYRGRYVLLHKGWQVAVRKLTSEERAFPA